MRAETHVKFCYWFPFLIEIEMCRYILVNILRNVVKTCSVVLGLLHAYRRTDNYAKAIRFNRN
jgi:hypothetical protein